MHPIHEKYIIGFIILLILIIFAMCIYLIFRKRTRTEKSDIISIKFEAFWPDFNTRDNWFIQLFEKCGKKFIITDDSPRVIIYSCFGNLGTKNYKFKKVFYTGENIRPKCDADINLSFDHTTECNNIRVPLWLLYGYDKDLQLTYKDTKNFCCFVYSNPIAYRNNFCLELSKYKKVDCGGNSLNNIGKKVDNKIEFQKNYKFCIAYENSSFPGYCSEKILEAYKSNCIPIYYGSSTVSQDFNPETFINAHNFANNEELIKYIIQVDSNDKMYQSFLNKPIYSNYWLNVFNDPEQTYFRNICDKICD